MRTDIDNKKQQIIEWLEQGLPRQEICRRLPCKYDTLKSRLDKWNIDLKNPNRKGIAHLELYKPAKYYIDNKIIISSAKLRNKLLFDGIKDHKCELCNETEWRGEPIPLELDHINSDHFDNRLENLQIICPNCHSQETLKRIKNKIRY